MNLQKKFDIAVKMLERGVSMDDIRFSSDEELVDIAEDSICIMPYDLRAFAEEVAGRSDHRQAREDLRQFARYYCPILVTDDPSSVTKKMHELPFSNEYLSAIAGWLDSRYQLIFHMRSNSLATRCSHIFSRKIEATNETLPPLKKGDTVLRLSLWQGDRGDDQRVIYTLYPYIPDH